MGEKNKSISNNNNTKASQELNGFIVQQKLGEGSYSSVYKVKRKCDDQDYAMKKIKLNSLSEKERENAVNEIRFLASISNSNVVGYKESMFDNQSNYLYIIMEYMSGGDVLRKLKTLKESKQFLDENTVWKYVIQLTQGLKALHDMKILHRDLKCANIFLSKDNQTVKIGDLNVSKVAKQGMLYTQTGTPYYASPEVWKDKPYNSKSDIWSLGCVLYEICALHPPFMGKDMSGLFQKVQRGMYSPIPSVYSSYLANLIESCLEVNPIKRPSCSQILKLPIVEKKMQQFMMNSQHSSSLSTDATNSQSSNGFSNNNNNNNQSLQSKLLQTIKFNKNLKNLSNKLPTNQYDSSFSKSPCKSNKQEDSLQQPSGKPAVVRQGSKKPSLAVIEQHQNILQQWDYLSPPQKGMGKVQSSKNIGSVKKHGLELDNMIVNHHQSQVNKNPSRQKKVKHQNQYPQDDFKDDNSDIDNCYLFGNQKPVSLGMIPPPSFPSSSKLEENSSLILPKIRTNAANKNFNNGYQQNYKQLSAQNLDTGYIEDFFMPVKKQEYYLNNQKLLKIKQQQQHKHNPSQISNSEVFLRENQHQNKKIREKEVQNEKTSIDQKRAEIQQYINNIGQNHYQIDNQMKEQKKQKFSDNLNHIYSQKNLHNRNQSNQEGKMQVYLKDQGLPNAQKYQIKNPQKMNHSSSNGKHPRVQSLGLIPIF